MKLMTTLAVAGALALGTTGAFAQDATATPEGTSMDAAAIIQAALAGGDATAGEKIFKKCKACHQIGDGAKNRVGPILTNVVANTIGSVEGYRYSKGMIARNEAGDVWTVENLDAWLTKPKNFIKKTKMSFSGLKKPEDRANLIAYLATFATTN